MKRTAAIGMSVLGLTICAFGVGMFVHHMRSAMADATEKAPQLRSGSELEVVFIGSSACNFARDIKMPSLFQSIVENLRREATSRAVASFAVVGIAVDTRPEDGSRFLHSVGRFDEEVVGDGWFNLGISMLVGSGVPLSVPQIVVLERNLDVDSGGIRSERTKIVADKIGLAAIVTWAKSGAVLAIDVN